MAFTPPPTPPNSGDPANFNPRADAFLGWFPTHVAELNLAGFPNMPVRAQIRGTAAAPIWSFKDDPDTGMWSPGANILAWSTGGQERLRLGATGLLTSPTAITQSATDATAGRLLKVGDFGIGSFAPNTSPVFPDDFNQIRLTGFLTVSASMANGPSGAAPSTYPGQLINLKRQFDTGASIIQTLFPSTVGNNLMYLRAGTGADPTFTPWRRVLTDLNVIGVASAPNEQGHLGAIIERGSNANGDFTRWADGTQICWRATAITTDPAAFVGTPVSIEAGKMKIGRWY